MCREGGRFKGWDGRLEERDGQEVGAVAPPSPPSPPPSPPAAVALRCSHHARAPPAGAMHDGAS